MVTAMPLVPSGWSSNFASPFSIVGKVSQSRQTRFQSLSNAVTGRLAKSSVYCLTSSGSMSGCRLDGNCDTPITSVSFAHAATGAATAIASAPHSAITLHRTAMSSPGVRNTGMRRA
jgi:hypothetical protein